jgi:hypothetical protein
MEETVVHALNDKTLIDLYEAGHLQTPLQRSLLILAVAYPQEATMMVNELTPGQRDARLLEIRKTTFGPEMQCVAACPICDEPLEFALDVTDFLAIPIHAKTVSNLTLDSYHVQFRLPTCSDLSEAAASTQALPGQDMARQTLLERCLVSVERDGQSLKPGELPEPVFDRVEQQMAELDPHSELRLDLTCASCNHRWLASFNVGAYVWDEIQQRARELLQEVHLLANAYGWTETDILALSPWRRRAYLDLAYV